MVDYLATTKQESTVKIDVAAHTVWIGPPSSGNSASDIIAVASLAQKEKTGTPITLWVLQQYVEHYQIFFQEYSNVNICSITEDLPPHVFKKPFYFGIKKISTLKELIEYTLDLAKQLTNKERIAYHVAIVELIKVAVMTRDDGTSKYFIDSNVIVADKGLPKLSDDIMAATDLFVLYRGKNFPLPKRKNGYSIDLDLSAGCTVNFLRKTQKDCDHGCDYWDLVRIRTAAAFMLTGALCVTKETLQDDPLFREMKRHMHQRAKRISQEALVYRYSQGPFIEVIAGEEPRFFKMMERTHVNTNTPPVNLLECILWAAKSTSYSVFRRLLSFPPLLLYLQEKEVLRAFLMFQLHEKPIDNPDNQFLLSGLIKNPVDLLNYSEFEDGFEFFRHIINNDEQFERIFEPFFKSQFREINQGFDINHNYLEALAERILTCNERIFNNIFHNDFVVFYIVMQRFLSIPNLIVEKMFFESFFSHAVFFSSLRLNARFFTRYFPNIATEEVTKKLDEMRRANASETPHSLQKSTDSLPSNGGFFRPRRSCHASAYSTETQAATSVSLPTL